MGNEGELADLRGRVLGLERKLDALMRIFAPAGSEMPPDAISGDFELIPWSRGRILLPPGVSPAAARAAFDQAMASQEPDPPATG
jgi:hypothetical protein